MIFTNDAHRDFYNTETAAQKADCYTKALIYTLGMCDDTRRNFGQLYNKSERRIVPDSLNACWQTGTSVKVTRLAFNLFTDGTPTACTYDEPNNRVLEDYNECRRYSVSDIFCCGYAPYFIEAIRVRYPEYMQ